MGLVADVELSSIIPWILYPWLAISIGVYGYRLYRRRLRTGATGTDGTDDDNAATTGGPTPPTGKAATGKAATGKTATGKTATGKAATVTRRPLPATPRPTTGPAAGILPSDRPGALVQEVIREELAARRREGSDQGAGDSVPGTGDTSTPPSRTGLFSPRATESEPRAVTDVLAGIRLPCDLAPAGSQAFDPTLARFLTVGHEPAAVGAAVGDELERLGFRVASQGDTVVIATRDEDTVRAELFPDARAAERDGVALFPSAPGASVGVELRSV